MSHLSLYGVGRVGGALKGVEVVSEYKYFGVYLGNKLDWFTHTTAVFIF